MLHWKSTFATILLFVSFSIHAAPITYSEDVQGDLSNDLRSPTYIGVLDTGINTVSGSSFGPALGYADFDQFSFTVSASQRVTSIIYSYSSDQAYVSGHLEQIMPDGSREPFAWYITGNSGPSGSYDLLAETGAGALSAGEYKSAMSSYGYLGSGDVNFDYTWEFHVSAVPVPASIWLFLSGCIGLTGFLKSRKSTS